MAITVVRARSQERSIAAQQSRACDIHPEMPAPKPLQTLQRGTQSYWKMQA
ncbi:MAG TPA: hypothetical protein VFL43_15000 [Variovorax sp.]|nr:hypothetical protein [Variovorax sp.]